MVAVEDLEPAVQTGTPAYLVVVEHALVAAIQVVAVVVDVGVETDVDESGGAIGDEEGAADAVGAAHVVGLRELDDAVEDGVVIIGAGGEVADFVGGVAGVAVDAEVAEAFEELAPSGFGGVGVGEGYFAAAAGPSVEAVALVGSERAFVGAVHAHRVVEFEVMHVLSAVGEV